MCPSVPLINPEKPEKNIIQIQQLSINKYKKNRK